MWHAVSKMKHVSEEMLDQYAKMLAEARTKKAEQLSQAEADDGQDPASSQ